MNIGVLAVPTDWHFNDLQRAATGFNQKLTAIDYRSFATLFETNKNRIDGRQLKNSETVDLQQLDALIVRGMPQGSLQQVVFRMDLLGQLVRDGVLVINSPRTVEASVDKYLALELIRNSGLSVPRTAVCEDLDHALTMFEHFTGDVVVKPLFGSLGRGIQRVTENDDVKTIFQEKIAAGEIIYLQEFVETENEDLRLLVVGQRVIAMKRHNPDDWITNASRGGSCHDHVATGEETELAVAAAIAVAGEIIGVDLARDRNGKLFVLEVNSAPGWRALSQTTGTDVARCILEYVARRINQHAM